MESLTKNGRKKRERERDICFIANMQIYFSIIDLWNWFESAHKDEKGCALCCVSGVTKDQLT